MPTVQRMLRCKTCKKPTLHIRDRPNHVLHLMLSVLTLGAWPVIWLFLSLFSGPPACTICGRDRRSFLVSFILIVLLIFWVFLIIGVIGSFSIALQSL